MINRIGRFEIRGELGRGAQSVVYLGFDPQLEREVAIKTVHLNQSDPLKNQQFLTEARAVGQLHHPNIVPVFDAGEVAGDPYLVFEYVRGQTLAEFLQEKGARPVVEAIGILRPVLDAVAEAHEHGIVHRDLKPSNILLDASGTPRVMDFGIAIRLDGLTQAPDDYTGTPAYMAPEYIAERQCSAQGDVFASGLILYELLTGQRAATGDNLFQIMHRIANEDIRLPPGAAVDEGLSAILYKALARDPGLRYQSAQQFAAALDHYLEPEESLGERPGRQATIEFLLRRMRHKSDFPALSESVTAINKIANSESESVSKLSNSILKDFALTNKLLRLVNAAYFRPAGGGSISTVSRAVIVLGFEAVRNIAITVLLFEHLENKGHANQLKDEFLRANLAGILARDISAAAKMPELEQIFICALFHRLGRLLAQYYFPEETDEIRRVMAQRSCADEQASLQVLGISFTDLGVAIARQWGFPPLIVSSMRRLPPGTIRKPATSEDRLRMLASFANEMCEVISQTTAEARVREMKQLMARFSAALPLDEKEVMQTLRRSVEETADFARIIQLNVAQTTFGKQMRQFTNAEDVPAPGPADPAPASTLDSLNGMLLGDAGAAGLPAALAADDSEKIDAQAVLTAGIQDISNTLVEGYKLNDILRIILETIYRAMGFRHVVLCVRDARTNIMQGRFGFGPDASEIARAFRFPLAFAPDIFHVATGKGVDILISDINDEKIAERIPAWYRKAVSARSFVLLPLNIKGSPVALIYADRDDAFGIDIPEKELSLLRTLRNQAVLAIKQGSS